MSLTGAECQRQAADTAGRWRLGRQGITWFREAPGLQILGDWLHILRHTIKLGLFLHPSLSVLCAAAGAGMLDEMES